MAITNTTTWINAAKATKATSAKQVSKALRKAGLAVDCFKGDGYVYFIADSAVEVDSVYVCYLNELSVERYVEHVAGFFTEAAHA